ncbi:DUF6701 domain-containing protein [sulfur-oxidizing endosymbiont of Gigantopelta aegis]|nr:DUF6701 domain-containing protein [sulfur-oxidizing endosymbiont of Gigantopelta aegis]
MDIGLNGDQFFWLQYDWDGDGDYFDTAGDASLPGKGNNPPYSRASFGIYNRSKRIIYTRELY